MIREHPLSSDTLWDKINQDFGEKGGAYRLFSKKYEQAVPINRLLGTDKEGTLYIGKATSYLDRVITLKKSIGMKSTSHICGRRYKKNKKVMEAFPYKNLYIQLIGHTNPEKKEKELLDSYFNDYGEVPPLNANG